MKYSQSFVVLACAIAAAGCFLSTQNCSGWSQALIGSTSSAFSAVHRQLIAIRGKQQPTLQRPEGDIALNEDTVGTSSQASETAHVSSESGPLSAATKTSVQQPAACKLSGQVADCGCDFASVENMNQDILYPLLHKLVRKPFFRFFKVNLYCDCQFWPESGMCFQKDCCVSECESGDIPQAWREYDQQVALMRYKSSCEGSAGVDRSVDEDVEDVLIHTPNWHGLNNPWVPEDDKDTDYIYVDLTKNTEKYTGYKGEDARRIWAAIYEQDAIKEAAQAVQTASNTAGSGAVVSVDETGGAGVAHEQRVLYRLISGMHASITMSIVQNFYDEQTETWGPNMPFFKARFASPWSQPYVENLYFTFLFVLRAVTKAGPALEQLDFHAGWVETEGDETKDLVSELVSSQALQSACPLPFDEGLLWKQHDETQHQQLRALLRKTFHNITRLMDCVGCEKCKMHGKLNMLGIATSLKILFSQQQVTVERTPDSALAVSGSSSSGLVLDRNEAIALVNFLGKLSDSVEAMRSLSIRLQHEEEVKAAKKAEQEAQGQATTAAAA